jgi:DeoR family fructose operon transcriptional repressor
MMQSSRRVVVLADHSKFDRSTFAQVADLDVADILITDALPDGRMAEALATAEVQVIVAGRSTAAVGAVVSRE